MRKLRDLVTNLVAAPTKLWTIMVSNEGEQHTQLKNKKKNKIEEKQGDEQ